ncbi:unknown [Porphyromonas sp. CAG:1061]|nr:unknown [Porphyromonas sp. CAG:1061]
MHNPYHHLVMSGTADVSNCLRFCQVVTQIGKYILSLTISDGKAKFPMLTLLRLLCLEVLLVITKVFYYGKEKNCPSWVQGWHW